MGYYVTSLFEYIMRCILLLQRWVTGWAASKVSLDCSELVIIVLFVKDFIIYISFLSFVWIPFIFKLNVHGPVN